MNVDHVCKNLEAGLQRLERLSCRSRLSIPLLETPWLSIYHTPVGLSRGGLKWGVRQNDRTGFRWLQIICGCLVVIIKLPTEKSDATGLF